MPAAGKFSWRVIGAELVNQAGAIARTGSTVYLRHYKPDPSAGVVPLAQVTVEVTYIHPRGRAVARKIVQVHEVRFKVTKMQVQTSPLRVSWNSVFLHLNSDQPNKLVAAKPEVQIFLGSCPRGSACAPNFRVGWLQTLRSSLKEVLYTQTSVSYSVPTPIRDAAAGVDPFPFFGRAAPAFRKNGDRLSVSFEDPPGYSATWDDPRSGAAKKKHQLQSMLYASEFSTWLVVQNIAFGKHHLAGSFTYLCTFNWSVSHRVKTRPTMPRSGSASGLAPTLSKVTTGKGTFDPVLKKATALNSEKIQMKPVDGVKVF
jgi:hypothetical protein